MNKKIYIGLAAAALLTACSNDELVSVKSNDNNPITFDSYVNKTTRATDITNSNISNFSVYAYTDGDDADEATSQYTDANGNPWYLLLDNEAVTGSGSNWYYTHIQYWHESSNYNFHAIAPYGDDAAADAAKDKRHWTFTPQSDNLANATIDFVNISEDENAKGEQDLIYSYRTATGLAVNNDVVKFEFSHLLSRVKFRFVGASTNPSSVTITVKDVTINDTYDKGKIELANTTNSTKSTLAGQPWTFEDGAAKVALSFGGTEQFVTETKETNTKYLIPQDEKVAYSATITYELEAKVDENDALTYIVTQENIALPEVQMLKGNSYVYVLDVKTGGTPGNNNIIEPIVNNIQIVEEWDMWEDIKLGNRTAETAQLFDYAMSDGSFVHLESGEYLTDKQKEECLGIVCWVDDDPSYEYLSDDEVLMRDYPNCTHGLIVSLRNLYNDGSRSYAMSRLWLRWQEEYVSVYDNFQKDHATYGSAPYTTIQCAIDDKGYPDENFYKLLGYNNTEVYKAYNLQAENKIIPVKLLTDMINDGRLKQIDNCSQWYIPSIYEMVLMCYPIDKTQNYNSKWNKINVAMRKVRSEADYGNSTYESVAGLGKETDDGPDFYAQEDSDHLFKEDAKYDKILGYACHKYIDMDGYRYVGSPYWASTEYSRAWQYTMWLLADKTSDFEITAEPDIFGKYGGSYYVAYCRPVCAF